ncbi:nucleotide pyrophosphohydrolase [Patescibacteria group bacterium]|nr:nucleotide pyrophosphohydrolase [Patescibacteria group bacterium]
MEIPKDDSLRKLQEYIWQMNIERKFNTEDPSKKLVMLMEEVGELSKAVRKSVGMKFAETTKVTDIEEELADVQIILLGLASLLNIDMFDAVVKKEEKNRERTWS